MNTPMANELKQRIMLGNRRRRDSALSPPDQLAEDSEDGPVFRATLSEFEKNLISLKKNLKIIVRSSDLYIESEKSTLQKSQELLDVFKGVSSLLPAVSYLEEAMKIISEAKLDYINQLESLVIHPLRSMYENDLALMEEKKKEFEKESDDYYAYQEKYLSMAKEKKESTLGRKDKKFTHKKISFNLKRLDYRSYIEELNTKKQQELLYHVSSVADKQYRFYTKCSKSLETLKPQLAELNQIATGSWTEISSWIKNRNEMRKTIEETNHATEMHQQDIPKLTDKQSKYRGIRDLDLIVDTSKKNIAEMKEGFLFTQIKREWRQVWCVLSDGYFNEYQNWMPEAKSKGNTRISLRTCTVKEAFKSERRFCFEIISPSFRKIYQASSTEDMSSWINVTQRSIELCLEQFAFRDEGGSPVDKNRIINELIQDPSNEFCAECSLKNTEWSVINLGITVCIECSGIHRSLGTHISKVRSLTLDTISWTPELILLQKSIGNSTSNSIWEEKLEESRRISSSTSREDKLDFIKKKYMEKQFIQPIQPGEDPFELLIESAKLGDIVGMIRALALNTNVNSLTSPSSEYQGKTPLQICIAHEQLISAELLLQNGCDINLQDLDMKTALHLAVESENEKAIKYLLARGAKKNIKNGDGETPEDKATPELKNLFTSSGNTSNTSGSSGNTLTVVTSTLPSTPHSGPSTPIISRLSQILKMDD